jgi:hypothetical protein
MLLGAVPGIGFHHAGPEDFRHPRSALQSLPGLFSLSASARLSPTGQEIRSQDNLFVSTARAAYPPFAPAVSIGSGVSENFQAAEKFPGQIVELLHGLLPFANSWRKRLNAWKFGLGRSLLYRQGNSDCRKRGGDCASKANSN